MRSVRSVSVEVSPNDATRRGATFNQFTGSKLSAFTLRKRLFNLNNSKKLRRPKKTKPVYFSNKSTAKVVAERISAFSYNLNCKWQRDDGFI